MHGVIWYLLPLLCVVRGHDQREENILEVDILYKDQCANLDYRNPTDNIGDASMMGKEEIMCAKNNC